MRRYINLLVIVVAVVAAIPFFYTALAADKDPGLMLKKISGNEKEIRNVKITALDNQEDNLLNRMFSITSSGSRYLGRESSFSLLDEDPDWYKQYVKQYPRFMRGKTNQGGFYEDRQMIAYADIIPQPLHRFDKELYVEVLDKKTRKTETMKRKVQGFSKQSFPSVWDVQKTGNELKVAAATDGDIRVYRVSLPDKKITGGKWITQRGQTGRMAQYTQLAETDMNKPNHILAYQEEKVDDDGSVKEMNTVIYKYYTNETKKLKPPINIPLRNRDNWKYVYNGKTVYMATGGKKGGARLLTFDGNGKLKADKTFAIKYQSTGNPIPEIKNGRLYFLIPNDSREKACLLYVFDISSGKQLYSGKVVQKGKRINPRYVEGVKLTIE